MTGEKYDTLFLIAQALKSGLSLPEAIRLGVDRPRRSDQKGLLRLADLLDRGIEPKEAVSRSGLPGSVAALFGSALKSGDFSGTLNELALLESKRVFTLRSVVQALAYPLFLFLCSIAIGVFLTVWTVPQFESIFRDFDTELPGITLLAIECSEFVRNPTVPAGVLGFVLVLAVCVKWLFPRFWFCVPVLGHIARSLYGYRMLRQLAYYVNLRMPLSEALDRCGETMRNVAFRRDCRDAAEAARKGMPLWEIALRFYWLFPPWTAPMLRKDGDRESIAKSLRRAAETVEQQKDVSILFLQMLSLPVFILLTFEVIGFFVLAMMAPLIKLIVTLSG